MNIEQRSLQEIKPYGKNAKKHPDKQVQAVATSIKEFGFNQPIVVDKDDVIIVGHGRYLAAHFLGLDQVPVMKLDLSEEKAKAYRLADNKLNESDWDMDLVIAELKSISLSMLDLTGFDRRLVLDLNDKDDVVPSTPAQAVTKVGDVYEMGSHRLICGDATLQETYTKLMAGVKADMIFTDPPYNVDYHGRGEKTSEGILNDKMAEAKFREFLVASFKNVREYMKAGGGSLRVPFELRPNHIPRGNAGQWH